MFEFCITITFSVWNLSFSPFQKNIKSTPTFQTRHELNVYVSTIFSNEIKLEKITVPFKMRTVLLVISVFQAANSELVLINSCDEPLNVPHLCTHVPNYNPAIVPRPWPITINSTVSINDITDVNMVDSSVTIFLEMIVKWFDDRVTLSAKNDSE